MKLHQWGQKARPMSSLHGATQGWRLRAHSLRVFLLLLGFMNTLCLLGASPLPNATPEDRSRVAATHSDKPIDWWNDNVWAHEDRPFLYYGTPPTTPHKATSEPTPTPKPLSAYTTTQALQREYERRKDVAIMNPTPANMTAFLEINSFLLGKAHQFQDAWQRQTTVNPTLDWTATHPVANFATTELKGQAESSLHAALRALGQEAGLIWVAGDDPTVNTLAAQSVAAFSRTYGFDVLAVTPKGEVYADLTHVRVDRHFSDELQLKVKPALLLVPKPSAKLPALKALTRPLLFSTGVQAGSTMGASLIRLLLPTLPLGNDAVLPTQNANALWASSPEIQ